MITQFNREEILLGTEALDVLKNSRVAVFGIGGVGGYAVDTEVADNRKNAGIGLSVCATIVRTHGGEIYAENRPSGGARFWFLLERERMSEEESHD